VGCKQSKTAAGSCSYTTANGLVTLIPKDWGRFRENRCVNGQRDRKARPDRDGRVGGPVGGVRRFQGANAYFRLFLPLELPLGFLFRHGSSSTGACARPGTALLNKRDDSE
jgi:hypothetical protein